jgi:hypothetical protein
MQGGGGRPGGMTGSQMDPEAMRAAMDVLRQLSQVPEEFSLNLREDAVLLIHDGMNAFGLTLGADEAEFYQGGATILGTARWRKDGLEIKRELDMGGGVKDKIRVDETGTMIVEREIDLPRGSVKGTLVYKRGTTQD